MLKFVIIQCTIKCSLPSGFQCTITIVWFLVYHIQGAWFAGFIPYGIGAGVWGPPAQERQRTSNIIDLASDYCSFRDEQLPTTSISSRASSRQTVHGIANRKRTHSAQVKNRNTHAHVQHSIRHAILLQTLTSRSIPSTTEPKSRFGCDQCTPQK